MLFAGFVALLPVDVTLAEDNVNQNDAPTMQQMIDDLVAEFIGDDSFESDPFLPTQSARSTSGIKMSFRHTPVKGRYRLPSATTLTDARRRNIARCLQIYYRLPVDAKEWRPWTIMHGLLPYGQQSRVTFGDTHYAAVDYLCSNAIGNDKRMLFLDGRGSFNVAVGPGVQGHEGQFLAMLAQADVPIEQKLYIQGQTFSVADLVEYEKKTCKLNTELTFKLIGLSHYLASDEIWRSDFHKSWNIERLIYEELKQPINGAACGGTHRLMGLSYAIKQRRDRGESIDGQWKRAAALVRHYQDHALRQQNPDGSFSTDWFVTSAADPDPRKRLYTTGHIVEWLALSLPTAELGSSAFQKSIDYLVDLILNAEAFDLETGPKGHALHALRIYEQRYFGANSDVYAIASDDYKRVKQALAVQKARIPNLPTAAKKVVPQKAAFQGIRGTGGVHRRIFRRR